MTTTATAETQKAKEPEPRKPHPIRDMLIKRSLIGVLTLLLVSILVFAATQTLPAASLALLLNSTPPNAWRSCCRRPCTRRGRPR